MSRVVTTFGLLLGWSLSVAAQEPPSTQQAGGRPVDQPIPQTYQPLVPSWVNGFSEEIQAVKDFKNPNPIGRSGRRATQSFPIHEPQPESQPIRSEGQITEHANEIRIRDAE